MFEIFKEFLKTQEVEYKFHSDISEISPVKIGGKALCIVYPKTLGALTECVDALKKTGTAHKILGRMTNVLPPDGFYHGVIIRTDRLSSFKISGKSVYAECGALLAKIAFECAKLGLTGLEELSGIPGSVGGMTVLNAGAFGRDISDVISSVTVYDADKEKIYDLQRNSIDFSYRHTSIRDRYVVLAAQFDLADDDSRRIFERTKELRELRRSTQPTSLMTLGSTFKRPEGAYAAELIDLCGLKGAKVGGAEISEKHAGFIVNYGSATAKDVIALMELCEREVYSRFGIRLEREIEVM